jgi:anti-anti-sigma factor
MHATSIGSRDRDGIIRVVPEADGIVAVCLEGEFDLANAPALGDELERELEEGNSLIMDLTEATFIDSSVINVLMRAVKTVGGRDQAIVLQLGTDTTVERVLDIAQVEQVVTRVHDRDEAVRSVQEEVRTHLLRRQGDGRA